MYQHDAQHTARADAPARPSLRAQGQSQGAARDERIQPSVRLLNDGASDVPLGEITLRYWYTDETAPSPQRFELTSATNEATGASIGANHVTSSFGSASRPKADRFVEVGFKPQAGSLAAGSGVALDFSVRAKNGKRYDERNDYSFRSANLETDWKRVTVYRNGALVFGREP
jgi:hypothetical protein